MKWEYTAIAGIRELPSQKGINMIEIDGDLIAKSGFDMGEKPVSEKSCLKRIDFCSCLSKCHAISCTRNHDWLNIGRDSETKAWKDMKGPFPVGFTGSWIGGSIAFKWNLVVPSPNFQGWHRAARNFSTDLKRTLTYEVGSESGSVLLGVGW